MPKLPPKPIVLRPASAMPVDVLAIGSSTGGPQALLSLLRGLGPNLKAPTLITQHMPATFTAVLADHIARTTGSACPRPRTASRDAGPHLSGAGQLPPGGRAQGRATSAPPRQRPPEKYCRRRSTPCCAAWPGCMAAHPDDHPDRNGLRRADRRAGGGAAGGTSSPGRGDQGGLGMPGAVATDGICSAVLPLSQIAPYVLKMIGGTR